MFIFKNLRPVVSLILLTLLIAGCGGLQEVWEGPGARIFRPQAIAVLPPMASQYDSAREDIQQVLSDEINKTSGIERVVSPENVTDIFQGSKEAFDALVFYFSRLEMTGQSDKDSAVKLGKALNVDSFLVVRVNSWEYMRKEGDNVGRVGLSLRLVDATTGTTVWKARHERSSSYMFYRPNLKDIAKELAAEMIKAMPPQAKQ
jgi:PBP1b-binding outer membrane lipoprotein LpoB